MIRSAIVAALFAAVISSACLGTAVAQSEPQDNLVLNGALKLDATGKPTGWKVEVLPPCGFRFAVHRPSPADAAGAGEFEFISEVPTESTLGQVLTLKPGWYRFTADIKIETLGSAGSSPELFAKSMTLPIQTRTHPMGWKSGWHKYELIFRTGPSAPQVEVGCALGSWGSPNTGRVLFRDPRLVPAQAPQSGLGLPDLEKYDLEKLANLRFGSPEAKDAFAPAKYPIGRHWTVAAVYVVFLLLAIFGWWMVSGRQAGGKIE